MSLLKSWGGSNTHDKAEDAWSEYVMADAERLAFISTPVIKKTSGVM
jgi:hypothetical protein